MTIPLEDYLRSIDPKYGSETHQRAFLVWMHQAQIAHPCTRDHGGEKPPTHRASCYPIQRGKAIATPRASEPAQAIANKPSAERVP